VEVEVFLAVTRLRESRHRHESREENAEDFHGRSLRPRAAARNSHFPRRG
jgi:hypothetical protein